jgi:short-subunit dehydrogenase
MHIAITGASSGIGEALARELARWDGSARLTLIARRRDWLERLAREIGPQCTAIVHDLSRPDHATAWIDAAEAASGPIDVLVNNAGIENTGPAADADLELATRLLATNLLSPLRITRALAPAMIARGRGMIVDISSVAALIAPPRQAWYGASKAALAMFSETLRAELRGTGVHVLTVYPGPVATAMAEAVFAKLGGRKGTVALLPQGKADVLARRIRRAMQRRAARVIYPRFYALARWFPWLARLVTELGAPKTY